MKLPGILLLSSLAGLTCPAVQPTSFDDFQAGTSTWRNGFEDGIISLGGGPGGADDYFLQVPSFGGGGVSSRLVIFSQSEWGGDYLAAGITHIGMDLANFGTTDLSIRLAFTEAQVRNGYVSLAPISLPAGAPWQHFVFPIDAASFAAIGTTATFEQALGSVFQFRILSQGGSFPTGTRGDSIEGSLGIDNIAALVVPEPTTAWFGLTVAALALGFARSRTRASLRA